MSNDQCDAGMRVVRSRLTGPKFCGECGAPVASPKSVAEYKQVTVLFADVVHSMDIAAAVGAERLREIMTELVDRATAVVQRYGGTVDKFTGDGIMAVFGAPVALEDHAVSCVPCRVGHSGRGHELAPDVKPATASFCSLRVGLNSGEVIAGEIGSRRRRLHGRRRTGRHGPADGIGGAAGRGDAQRVHGPAGRERGAAR